MSRSAFRVGLAAGLLALSGAALAQAVPTDEARQATTEAMQQEEDPAADRFCIRETGSRIPVARKVGSKDDNRRCLSSNGRVYSRDDIRSTGRTDLADALRALDPAIH